MQHCSQCGSTVTSCKVDLSIRIARIKRRIAAMNFKRLHYFWRIAKAGSIARASEQLHPTPQTISGRIGLLEDDLGCLYSRRPAATPEDRPQPRADGCGATRPWLRAGHLGRHGLAGERRLLDLEVFVADEFFADPCSAVTCVFTSGIWQRSISAFMGARSLMSPPCYPIWHPVVPPIPARPPAGQPARSVRGTAR